MQTGQTYLSGGSLSPEDPAVLAEGWKEANIRMGLLRWETGKSAPIAGKHVFPGEGRARILRLVRLRAVALRVSLGQESRSEGGQGKELQVTGSGEGNDWGISGPGTDLGRQRASVGRKL